MKQLLLITFLFSSLSTFASIDIDSLRREIYKSEGKKKVDLLLLLAINDKANSKTAINEALNLSVSIGYRLGEYNSLMEKAIQSPPEKSIANFKKALDVAMKLNNPKKISHCLTRIGLEYQARNEMEEAIGYFRSSYKNFQKVDDKKGMAQNLNNTGVTYFKIGLYDSCIHYYEKALSVYRSIGNEKNMAGLQINLGMVYKDQGYYKKALSYSLKALNFYEQQQGGFILAICYENIGSIYSKLEDYDHAIYYHQQALKVRKSAGNEPGTAKSLNNLGTCYQGKKMYRDALSYFSESVEIKKRLNKPRSLSKTLNNIGEVHFALKDYKKSEKYYRESLKIKRLMDDKKGIAISLNKLGELTFYLSRYEESEQNLKEAYSMAKDMGLKDVIRENLELKVLLEESKGELKTALYYTKELMRVKDSLLNKEKAESLNDMQTKYETEKKEKDIIILQEREALQSEKLYSQRLWIYALAVLILVSLVYAVFIRLGYVRLKKAKKKIQFLHRELNHRVKNNLQVLSSIFSLQSEHFQDEKIIEAIKSGESRVNAMAIIHQKLYLSDEIQEVNVNLYVTELVNYLLNIYGYSTEQIKLNLKVDDVMIGVDKAIPIGLIINELVSNSLKYAFIDHPQPALGVIAEMNKAGGLSLTIEDNGKNQPVERGSKSKPSFGLKMVKTLVNQLKGEMNINSSQGFCYQLHFK